MQEQALAEVTSRQRRQALEAALVRDRIALRLAVSRLKGTVEQRTDVRRRVVANPYAWLLGSFAVGFVLGRRR